MKLGSLDCLPEEVLLQIIRSLDLKDRIRLQLVCTELCALLLSRPPGEGLWGNVDLSYEMSHCVEVPNCWWLILGDLRDDDGDVMDPGARG